MNYKNLLLILFFLTSCTVQSTQYSENIFSNRGFVLLYDESLIEKKLLRKPLDDRSLEIVHNTLSNGTKVRIINLLNNKSTNAIVKTKNKDLFFYNSIFSKRIFDELDISLKEPYKISLLIFLLSINLNAVISSLEKNSLLLLS